MEVFEFNLNGSYFVLILSIVVASFLSYYTYRITIPPLNSGKKRTLIFLRSLALSILLFLIFEPFINVIKEIQKEPSVAVFIDNSLSMSFESEKYSNKNELNKVINNISNSDIDIQLFEFSSSTEKIDNTDSLQLIGNDTDISINFDVIERSLIDDNYRAAIIISDGNFNEGENPVYKAERAGLPVYTIGIGDTSSSKDLIINSIITNKIAYIDNAIPVNVNLELFNIDQTEFNIYLKADGQVLDSQKVRVIEGKENYSLIFEYVPNKAGNIKIEAFANEIEGEITTKNNSSFEYVKVLENKKVISLFGGAPSSDISFLSKYFAAKKGIELNKFIQKNGPKFYKEPQKKDIIETELFIFAGFPNVYTPSSVIDQIINELEKGKPFLFLYSYDIDNKNLDKFRKYLPFNILSSGRKEFEAGIFVPESNLSDPLIKYTGSESDLDLWNELPPIYKTETFVKAATGSKVVMNLKMNNSVLEEPMIIRRDINGNKSIAVLAYGLYKWKLSFASDLSKNKLESVDMFSLFMDNSLKWLSVKENRKRFTVSSLKKTYNSGEDAMILAELYDEKFDPFNDALVELNLINDDDKRQIQLKSIGNGRYTTNIEGLRSGDYEIFATAYFNDQEMGKDNTRFNVGETPKEFLRTGLNTSLMKMLAERSNGKFYYPDQSESVFNDIRSSKDFKSKNVIENSRIDIWQHPYLLVLSILIFSIEWFIRKRAGML